MAGFEIVEATGMKEITSYQATQWAFGNFLVPCGLPKIIVVDADGIFLECSRRLFNRPYKYQYMQWQGANTIPL